MRCRACGCKNLSGANYCRGCGRKLRSRPDPTFFKVFTLITVTINCVGVLAAAVLICALICAFTGKDASRDGAVPGPLPTQAAQEAPANGLMEGADAASKDSDAAFAGAEAASTGAEDAEPLYALKDIVNTGEACGRAVFPPGYRGSSPLAGADPNAIRTIVRSVLRAAFGEFDSVGVRVTGRSAIDEGEAHSLMERLAYLSPDECRRLDAELLLNCANEKKRFPFTAVVVNIGGSWYLDPDSIGF